MKKQYRKPELLAERFELAEHIAMCTGYNPLAPKDTQVTSSDEVRCQFLIPNYGMTLFGGNCDLDAYGSTHDWTLYCYNNPNDNVNGSPFAS